MEKKVLVSEILSAFQNEIIDVKGDVDSKCLKYLKPVGQEDKYSLDWVSPTNPNGQEFAENTKAKTIICNNLIDYNKAIIDQDKVLIVSDNPKLLLLHIYDKYLKKQIEKPTVAPSAEIHPNAIISPTATIGENCKIGDCTIGDDSVIYSNVVIYDNVFIGQNTHIHSGAVICVDGLGCLREKDGALLEFPQLGGVSIGNNVYIGANTLIASGSLAETIIGDGCKINGMCFIGSNCVLSDNVWITGSTMLAGSVKVGKNTTIFSRVVVKEWLNIGENVTIGMGSIITKNIPNGETWFGSPAKKQR